LGHDGRIVTANRRALKTLGTSAPDLVGCDFAELHPQDSEQVRTRLTDARRKPGTAQHWETRIRLQDGEPRWIRETACVVDNTGGGGEGMLLVVCEDITDERERA